MRNRLLLQSGTLLCTASEQYQFIIGHICAQVLIYGAMYPFVFLRLVDIVYEKGSTLFEFHKTQIGTNK